jgi:hypothetical protein
MFMDCQWTFAKENLTFSRSKQPPTDAAGCELCGHSAMSGARQEQTGIFWFGWACPEGDSCVMWFEV